MISENNVESFGSFISKFKLLKKSNDNKVSKKIYTHTAMGPPFGTFNIPDGDLKKFYELYDKEVQKGTDLFFTEKPKPFSPLCIDIDFRQQKSKRRYSDKTIKNLISKVNKKICEYYDVKEKLIQAFIFEKPSPSYDEKQKNYKDGFHIVYPYIPMSFIMKYLILHEVREQTREKNSFKVVKATNSLEDIFDTSVVEKTGWMVYGSRKFDMKTKKMSAKYELTNIYSYKLKTVDIPDTNLAYLLSVRRYDETDKLPFNEVEDNIEFQDKLEMVREKYSKSGIKQKRNKNINNFLIQDDEQEDNLLDSENAQDDEFQRPRKSKLQVSNDLEEVRKLLNILSPKRASNYDDWIYVGWCLFNISDSTEMLQEWLKFSMKAKDKYDKTSCIDLWKRAKYSSYTIASLHHWAKKDNPVKYCEYMTANIKAILNEAESGTHYDIALVVQELYKHSYVCSNIKKGHWYEFQRHRWVKIDGAFTLSVKISSELTREFSTLVGHLYTKSAKEVKQEADNTRKRADTIQKVIKNLKGNGFKEAVIRECANLFFVKDFDEKLDANKDLIGFENGIYDLSKGKFRAGLPDDYITFSTGYDYKEYSMSHSYVKSTEEFFYKLQTEGVMKQYLLELFASYLDGHNKQQRFVLFTGFQGSNGKSTAVDFLTLALGDYASTVPHTILTRRAGSAGQATPELADKRGVRFISINEPDGDDKIYVGTMKLLSGNDKILARPLYGDPFYYTPQFKMVLICNKLPFIPSGDGGTWRRLRVTPWESRFIDLDEKISGDKEFYKDPEMESKMKKWKRAFMWLLLNKYYPKYKNNGYCIVEPDKVKKHTDKYRKDSDIYFEFIEDYFEITNNKADKETLMGFYQTFKSWYRESYTSSQCPSKKDVKEYLSQQKYMLSGGTIYGMRLKGMENNDIKNQLDE